MTSPRFLRAQLLDAHEEVALFVVGEVKTELFRLDPDRVDPALLSEDDAPLGRDELGGVRLDRGRVVELAGHGSGFAAEEVVADERLERLELVSRDFAELLRESAGAVEPQVRLDAVEPP